MVDLAEIFGDIADYVVAHLPMESATDIEWLKSPADKAMKNLGAVNLDIADLSVELTTAIKSSTNNFVSALNRPEDLPRFSEVQMCQWLESVGQSLDDASNYLIPESMGSLVLDY